jgi:uncharacterized protein (TIGR02231 family)
VTETVVAAHEAPIVAVTVFPDRARVTRRTTVRLVAGEQAVVLDGLALSLQTDSVRVAGQGPATILGVDVARRHRPRTTDAAVLELEEQLRGARATLAELDDDAEIAQERLELLARLGRRASGTYARALAEGSTGPGAVAGLADALDAQQADVRATRRELAQRREKLVEQVAAYERQLDVRRKQRVPDQLAATVALEVTAEAEVTLELSYVVTQAGWRSAYDLRLLDDRLTLNWYGLVSQQSGEDWPECELQLSTARPSGAVAVPELRPWFLDRMRPMVLGAVAPMAPVAASAKLARSAARAEAPEEYAELMSEIVAQVQQGATAATYTPARPVAVPADGGTHRATVAALEFEARLDYVTAPVLSAEAHLRATVTNTSEHTIPAGTAAVFHGGDFVGSSSLDLWAPGEEIELALGVDDRIRVERELVRRTAGKALIGSTRRREAEHRITVTNHTPAEARVTVLDQLPVARDEAITVSSTRLEPAPAERTDLGVLTWVLQLPPGAVRTLHVGVRVEVAKGVELRGWRE